MAAILNILQWPQDWGDHIITIGDKKLKETGGYFEKEMPEMFTLKMLQGNRTALNDPSSILLSASAAKAYFGNEDAMNKLIKIDQMPPLKVAGVYKDFPQNSTLADLNFISTGIFWYNNNGLKRWKNHGGQTLLRLFVQINDNADFAAVSAKIKDAKLKKVNDNCRKRNRPFF